MFPEKQTNKQTNKRARQDSSARVIDSPQRHTTDAHSFPQRGSNPKCQQSSGIRPTPQTARTPGSAICKNDPKNIQTTDSDKLMYQETEVPKTNYQPDTRVTNCDNGSTF